MFPISLVEALNNTPQNGVDELLNYDSVKSHLTMQIVSTEYNAEKLADVPHKEIQDMSIVYRIDLAARLTAPWQMILMAEKGNVHQTHLRGSAGSSG